MQARSRRLRTTVVSLAMTAVTAGPAAAVTVQQCRSANNDLYLIVTTGSGSIGTQVTSVALGQGSPCTVSEAGGDGEVLTAVATTTGPLLASRRRTAVLNGFPHNGVSCVMFDPSAAGGAGILTLPGGLRTVSVDPMSSTEPLVDVATAGGGVPAAVGVSVSRTIGGGISCTGNSMVFPFEGTGTTLSNAATGEVANQSVTLDDTSGTRIGNPVSQPSGPDGFLLRGDCTSPSTCQIIVFTARPDGATFYGVAAAGFTANADLVQNQTEGNAQNGIFPVLPPPPQTASPRPAPAASPWALGVFTAIGLWLQFVALRRRGPAGGPSR